MDPHHQPQHPCDQTKQRPPLIAREYSTGSCFSARSIVSNASASSTRTHRRSRLEIGSTFFAQTPENRCPTVAIASYSGGTRVQSFDTLETRSSCDGKSTTLVQLSPSPDSLEREHACGESSTPQGSIRAAELIRELSFDGKSSSRDPERRSSSPSLDGYQVVSNVSGCPPAHVNVGREGRGADEMDEPPLPPKIKRISTPPPASVRNRLRSTSISEMSQSFFEDFANNSDAESVLSSGSSPSTTRYAVLRTQTPVERMNSLVTIDSVCMSETMPTSQMNRRRASTMMSCASTHSYVSSSSSDDLSCCTSEGSEGSTSEQDELLLALSDISPAEGVGRSSLHDYYFDENEKTAHPRLTSEVLKRWDEQQDGQGDGCFVSRALSCASRLGGSHTSSSRSEECSEGGPHLIAAEALSHHSFELSYTNTGHSSGPPSTITSVASRRQANASDLDFDVTFIYSYSQDKTHDDVDLDCSGHALRPRGHRRIRSTGSGIGIRTLAQPKTYPWDNVTGRPCKRRHRRYKSEGNIDKPRILALPQDLSSEGNSTGVNDSPRKILSRHRREVSLEGIVEKASLASRKSHQTVTTPSVHEGPQHLPVFLIGNFSLHSLLVGFLMGLAVGMYVSASLN